MADQFQIRHYNQASMGVDVVDKRMHFWNFLNDLFICHVNLLVQRNPFKSVTQTFIGETIQNRIMNGIFSIFFLFLFLFNFF